MRSLLSALALALWPAHATAQELGVVGPEWESVAIGDFNGDGKPDLMMRRKTDGLLGVWLFNGAEFLGWYSPGTITQDWKLFGLGDFNGDKKPDVVWRHDGGMVYLLLMSATEPPPPDPQPQPTPSPTPQVQFKPWAIGPNVNGVNYSHGMPTFMTENADGSFSFTLGAGQDVHAVVAACGGSLGGTMRVRWKAEGSFSPLQGSTPTASLFFQRAGDNWTGAGAFANFRWYHVEAPTSLPGQADITVPLQPQFWTNVFGQHDAAGFAAALSACSNVAVVFGDPGAGSTAHGVRGQGTFTLLEFTVH